MRTPEDSDERAARARPQLTRLVPGGAGRTATLVSGWVWRGAVRRLLTDVARALGERLAPAELARLEAALAAVSCDDEHGLEWRLALGRPLLAHFVPGDDERLLAVDVLLEDEHEAHVAAVHGAFAASTVDPPTA